MTARAAIRQHALLRFAAVHISVSVALSRLWVTDSGVRGGREMRFAPAILLAIAAAAEAERGGASLGSHVALFVHGFRMSSSPTNESTIRLHQHGTADAAFGSWPDDYQQSFIVEYSSQVPFSAAVAGVRSALTSVPSLDIARTVVHAHGMGALLAVEVLRDSTPLAFIAYDAPWGGFNPLLQETILALTSGDGASHSCCVHGTADPWPALDASCLTHCQ